MPLPCGGHAPILQSQPYQHRTREGDQPQLQPQPCGRLATAEPGERAGQRDAQAHAGVDPGAEPRSLPPGQFGQAPTARTDQHPGAEDAGGGAQPSADEAAAPRCPGRGQRRQRHTEQGQPHAAERILGEPGRGQGPDEVAAVVGRRPFSSGGGAQGAVTQHQWHQGREREPSDAHGNGEGDDAAPAISHACGQGGRMRSVSCSSAAGSNSNTI